MKRTKIAATCALFVLLGLLGAGCGAPTRRASRPPDTPCSTCTHAACGVESNACLVNADCQRLLVCVAAEGRVCGPATPTGMSKIQDLLDCWEKHCPAPLCPSNPGATT